MGARFRLWWQRISKPLDTIIISFIIILAALIIVSILGYLFRWEWTGLTPSISPPHPNNSDFLPGKTLWDWLQLLIIPAVLAIGGYLFNYSTSRNERKAADKHNQTEREIAWDNQREAALQEYIDKMSELLLHQKLRESQHEDEVQTVARVRTLTTLSRLDNVRKGNIIKFLYESRLIEKGKSIVSLSDADLSEVCLSGANLSGADLVAVNLAGADLTISQLFETNLTLANLTGANLSNTILFGANFRNAKMIGANLSEAFLNSSMFMHPDDPSDPQIADLSGADLSGANLSKTDLIGVDMRGSILRGANLRGAKITQEQLSKTRSLEGATMPDGTIHS